MCGLCNRKTFGKSVTRDFASTVSSPHIVVENIRCTNWYCDFNTAAWPPPSSSLVSGTNVCGDQLCTDKNNCYLEYKTYFCCFVTGANVGLYYITVEPESVALPTTPPYSAQCYLVETLSNREVLICLREGLEARHFSLLASSDVTLAFACLVGNDEYDLTVDGDDNKLKLTVTVSRRGGEYSPQVYKVSYMSCLSLVYWHRFRHRYDKKESGEN